LNDEKESNDSSRKKKEYARNKDLGFTPRTIWAHPDD